MASLNLGFFVNETTDQIEINIYDVLGNLVDTIVKSDLVIYENNEVGWNVQNHKPGLYFAEIISSKKQQDIIKIVIGY